MSPTEESEVYENRKVAISKLNIRTIPICQSGIKGIINYRCVPLKQSNKQCTFKFWNMYSSALFEKYQNFSQQRDFAS
jgi:hypothetical protein